MAYKCFTGCMLDFLHSRYVHRAGISKAANNKEFTDPVDPTEMNCHRDKEPVPDC